MKSIEYSAFSLYVSILLLVLFSTYDYDFGLWEVVRVMKRIEKYGKYWKVLKSNEKY